VVEVATAPVVPKVNENTEALADSWESAEDSAEKEEERVVSVYNFPMKPFISIAVKPQSGQLTTFRDDDVMDIARLKKEFDQLDRSLTAATSEYIVYALAKTGGIRIIRQDDGSDRQVFRATRDRVFNVALCTAGDSEVQAIIGIGVSGSVYWALISRSGKDFFDMDALESESLIFPPFPASDENTSGGQLKTRAKRSTRHTNLFAIGRGKNIYVVSPKAAMNPAYGVSGTQRTVNTEKFFKERALKISTGKAGKDFAFSDDDSVIASLDKTGRLRFWDINDMLTDASLLEGPPPAEIRVPLTTFVTGSPTEKSWPTSVLFLDKLRAYSRSMALRYVLVGLKQNHTLQLWDIGLGKAVQELKFPHENESDAICSVAYHPASGVVVVGHPTRNSIYFAHLSAPRYNLPQMSQASYIQALNDKDNTVPKPESTACLSGIREISLGSKGQLRSLELLPISKSATEKRGTEESALFELYVMHSRGVTCLNIKKEDLGWTADNKVIRPVDAVEHGLIEISELATFPSFTADDPSINGDNASVQSRAAAKEPIKKADVGELTSGVAPSRNASPIKSSKKKAVDELTEVAATPIVAEKSDKKKKKKAATAEAKAKDPVATAGVEPLPVPPVAKEYESLASSTAAMGATQVADQALSATPNLSGFNLSSEALGKHIQNLENTVSTQFSKTLGLEFDKLNRLIDDERRHWDATGNAKQDQVLRLVSSSLSDNVEKNLAHIVSTSIQNDVIPTLTDNTTAAVSKQLNGVVAKKLGGALNEELRQALPQAIINAIQQPAVVKAITDSVAQKLSPRIEAEVVRVMQSSLAPMLESLGRTTQKVESNMESHLQAQIKYYEAQRQVDNAKMEEMSNMLRGLTQTVASLATKQGNPSPQRVAQHDVQRDIQREAQLEAQREAQNANVNKRASVGRPPANQARIPQQLPQQQQPVPQPAPVPQAAPVPAPAPVPVQVSAPRTPEEAELADIVHCINTGHYEEGTVKVCFRIDPFSRYFH
jgi:WD40 repeat protein